MPEYRAKVTLSRTAPLHRTVRIFLFPAEDQADAEREVYKFAIGPGYSAYQVDNVISVEEA